MKKITGIKKAAGTMKTAEHAIAYMNTTTGEVWANEYVDENSWTKYDDAGIINLKHWIGYAVNELGTGASWDAILTWAAEAAMNTGYADPRNI